MTDKNILFGMHAVHAVLKNQPERVQRFYILKDRLDQKMQSLMDLATTHHIVIEKKTRQELDQLADHGNHQGVLLVCSPLQNLTEEDLKTILQNLEEPPFLLILDGVQDPHNLGACLRSAEALGVHAVIAPKDKSVGLTPTVLKVASGALSTLPFVQVTNLARTMQFLKTQNIWLYGADAEASLSLPKADLKGAIGLVLGAEGTGLRRLTKENCDVLLQIPMQGSVSSLNVSVATGIFLYEALRQRLC
jgi:23S rRNA (guanosine2251-2'-O)-methyltransferase